MAANSPDRGPWSKAPVPVPRVPKGQAATGAGVPCMSRDCTSFVRMRARTPVVRTAQRRHGRG